MVKKWWVVLLICIPLVLIILLFNLHYSIRGTITNITDGLPIQNIEVRIGDKTAKTDIKGKFSFSGLPVYFSGNLVVRTQDKYETVEPIKISFSKRNKDLKAQLVPTPLEMEKAIFGYARYKQYRKRYNLLHPDIQAKVSEEDYVNYMTKAIEKSKRDASEHGIITFTLKQKHGEVKLLPTWEYKEIGKTYNDVVEIQTSTSVILQTVSGEMTYVVDEGTSHLVKSGGYWRWFLDPEQIEEINKNKK